MRNRFYFIFMFILVGLLAACSAEPTPTTVSEPAPTTASESAPTIPAESNYLNEEGDFFLTLPEGWNEFGPVLNQIEPDKPFLVFYFFPGTSAPDGGINVSHVLLADKTEWTAEELVKTQCRSCPTHPFEETTLGGKPAQRTQIGGGEIPALITWYFFENGDFLIGMTFVDPITLESLDEIVESIYFQ